MLAVAFGNGVMAGRAGIVAHIGHPRPDIPVARRILLRCLSSMVLALPALPQPFTVKTSPATSARIAPIPTAATTNRARRGPPAGRER